MYFADPQAEPEQPTPAPPPPREERAQPAAYVPPQSRNKAAEPVRRHQAVSTIDLYITNF